MFVRMNPQDRNATTDPRFITSPPVFRPMEYLVTIDLAFLNGVDKLHAVTMLRPVLRFNSYTKGRISVSPQFDTRRFARARRFINTRTIVIRLVNNRVLIRDNFAFTLQTRAIAPVMNVHVTSTQPTGGQQLRYARDVRYNLTMTALIFSQKVLSRP